MTKQVCSDRLSPETFANCTVQTCAMQNGWWELGEAHGKIRDMTAKQLGSMRVEMPR